MSRTSVIIALVAVTAFGVLCVVANIALVWDAGSTHSAVAAVPQTAPIADQSVPPEARSDAPPKTEKQSCWRPGFSRNIGIAEPSCDVFTSERPLIEPPPGSLPLPRRQLLR